MKDLLLRLAAVAMVCLAYSAGAAVPAKKAPPTKSAAAATAAPKKGAAAGTSKKAATSASATRRGATPVRRNATTWRNRQTVPTPERYKEIQEALATKGYLPAGEATGTWGPSSSEALKRFQAEQKLDPSGKINSLSLIALGLGPKRETSAPKPPVAPVPEAPASK